METKAATNQHATEHNLPDTIAVLSRTPAALDALLRDLPDVWTRRNEDGDTWSVFDVIGHLIQGERTDWMPRAEIILQFGETRAFDPFERLAQRRESEGKSLGQLLDEFDSLRAANLDELRALKADFGGLAAARTASGSRWRYALTVAGDVDSSRPHAPAPGLPNHGAPVSGGRGSVERLSRRAAVYWS